MNNTPRFTSTAAFVMKSSGESAALSVFDLDHTLLKVNSSYYFGHHLYKKNYLPFSSFVSCLCNYGLHKMGFLSIDQIHQKSFEAFFYQRPLAEISSFVTPFLDEHLNPMLNRSVLGRLQQAQLKGEYTAILSSSPQFLVQPIAERLGIDLWCASSYQEDGKGALASFHVIDGPKKAQVVNEIAQSLQVNMDDITVFSDSILDLPMLEIAGEAVAVDPDSSLKKLSRKRGWEII